MARHSQMHGRRRAEPPARRPSVTRAALSVSSVSVAFAMLLATSTPALVVAATGDPHGSVFGPLEDGEAQQLEVGSGFALPAPSSERYEVNAAPKPIYSMLTSLGRVALIDTGTIVWPVLEPTKRSDGFGPRAAPCAGCSTNHDGVDFNPGNGTPVMSIADGVVVLATENGGGLGVNVEVQHNSGGELITSSYAHMQFGSIAVAVGERVTAGQQLGLVGNTGQSTGPHLHLEMFGVDGIRFDSYAWLTERVR